MQHTFLFRTTCVLAVAAFVSGCASVDRPTEATARVIEPGARIVFFTNDYRGVITAPTAHQRLIRLNSNSYRVSLADAGGSGPLTATYDAAGSADPAARVEVFYDEAVRNPGSAAAAWNAGSRSSDSVIRNNGIYVRISNGKLGEPVSIVVRKAADVPADR